MSVCIVTRIKEIFNTSDLQHIYSSSCSKRVYFTHGVYNLIKLI